MSYRRESHWREFGPVVVPEREFHSGTKFRNSIVEMRNDPSFRSEIGLPVDWTGSSLQRMVLPRDKHFLGHKWKLKADFYKSQQVY